MTRSLFLLCAGLAALGCGSHAAPPASNTAPAAPAAPAAHATPAASQPFAARVAALGMVFDAPAGYSETAIRKNLDVAYDHAVVSADQRIEMRFALRPYRADMPPPTRTRQFSWTFFQTGILNLTHGGNTGEAAPPEALPHEEFGADDARMVVMRFQPSTDLDYFSAGYELGVAIFLHRDGVGDAYTFVLFKGREDTKHIDEATMHALRFAARAAGAK
jgi:hypothetical protein